MHASEPLRLLQITDLHLRLAQDGELYGVRTNDSFKAVLARALGDPRWRPAAVLVTGDLAEDAAPEVYARFRTVMEPVRLPVLCLPGNHDDPAVMARSLPGGEISYCEGRSFGGWHLILLDSVVPGEPGGAVSEGELRRLGSELAAAGDRWVLVAVHHQPLPMGSAWLDGLGLRNGAALLGLLGSNPRVRGVVWGHVHQASDRHLGNLRLLSTPSTCAQFAPGTATCVMDLLPPGFRRLELLPDGGIRTEVAWLDDWVVTGRPPDSRKMSGPEPVSGPGHPA